MQCGVDGDGQWSILSLVEAVDYHRLVLLRFLFNVVTGTSLDVSEVLVFSKIIFLRKRPQRMFICDDELKLIRCMNNCTVHVYRI